MKSQIISTLNGSKGIEIILTTQNGKPCSRDQITAIFSYKFNCFSNDFIEEKVNAIWEEKCNSNNRLYNRSKFRFSGLSYNDQIIFEIGLTSYKELMGTNCKREFGLELVHLGKKDHSNASAYLSNALGVGALLITKDGFVVFIKRAMWTGEEQGHPEPENINSFFKEISTEDLNSEYSSLSIRNEIFDSVKHELHDELNVPLEALADPLLLGICSSLERLGRPGAEFIVNCSLTSCEVETLYLQNTQLEADESTGIMFVSEEKIRKKDLDVEMWQNLTDAACGAIELYCELMESNDTVGNVASNGE